jgi:hypothetical protein
MRRLAALFLGTAVVAGVMLASPAAAVYLPGGSPYLYGKGDPAIRDACGGVSGCLNLVNSCWADGGLYVEIMPSTTGHGTVNCYG